MKKTTKKIFIQKVIYFFTKLKSSVNRKFRESYAQSGEDMILSTIFGNRKDGVYVDVGANNPFFQSNTHFFYKKGWRGINIDALPGSMNQFKRIRSKDINLEIPISDKEETLVYYMFSSSFYNSFSPEQANTYRNLLIGTKEITTKTLSQVFDKYLDGRSIDFLTIDVEGWDLQVLKSNNWDKYSPKIILIEFFAEPNKDVCKSEIGIYLNSKGYSFLCNSITNSFFIKKSFFEERFHS